MKIRISVLLVFLTGKIHFDIFITPMHHICNGFNHSTPLILPVCSLLKAFLHLSFQLHHFKAHNYFLDTWNIIICRGDLLQVRWWKEEKNCLMAEVKRKVFFRARWVLVALQQCAHTETLTVSPGGIILCSSEGEDTCARTALARAQPALQIPKWLFSQTISKNNVVILCPPFLPEREPK